MPKLKTRCLNLNEKEEKSYFGLSHSDFCIFIIEQSNSLSKPLRFNLLS
jgi:hypothetical protein